MGEDSPEDPTPATPLIRIESSSPVSTGISELDRELGGGLKRNVIHSFSGINLDEVTTSPILLCSYLAMQCRLSAQGQMEYSQKPIFPNRREIQNGELRDQRPVLWLGLPHQWPTPWVLHQLTTDISPRSCLFIETKTTPDLLWALKTALSSRAVSALVAPVPRLTFRETQSLSVLARLGFCTAFFYTAAPRKKTGSAHHSGDHHQPSGYYSHWFVEPIPNDVRTTVTLPSFSITLRKTKGKQPKNTQWRIVWDEGRFRAHDTQSADTESPTNEVPLTLSARSLNSPTPPRYGTTR